MKIGRILIAAAIAVVFLMTRTSASTSGADTVYHIHEGKNDNIWENYDKWGDDKLNYGIFDRPMIEVFWGSAKETIHPNAFKENFLDNGNIELRLGESSKRRMVRSPGKTHNIIKQKDSYIFLGNIKSSYSPTKQSKEHLLETSSWRLGIGATSGLGYKMGDAADIVLYHTSALVWTKTDFLDKPNPNGLSVNDYQKDWDVINTIGNQIRFGTLFEGGVKFQFADFIGVKLGYERSVVFPRHMFWYWVESEIVEGIGQGLIDQFTDPFVRMSPSAAPIVTFLLKNGLSYAMYELRNKHMNWPVNTIAPFAIESFKIGVNFTF